MDPVADDPRTVAVRAATGVKDRAARSVPAVGDRLQGSGASVTTAAATIGATPVEVTGVMTTAVSAAVTTVGSSADPAGIRDGAAGKVHTVRAGGAIRADRRGAMPGLTNLISLTSSRPANWTRRSVVICSAWTRTTQTPSPVIS